MSSHIPRVLADAVRERADHRCEYCRLSQVGQEAAFHVDHVHPRKLGGETEIDNLALACVSCSLRKGAAVQAPDPVTSEPASIFHPRRQIWTEHFQPEPNGTLTGLTPEGRATVAVLKINRGLAVQIRAEEAERGRYP